MNVSKSVETRAAAASVAVSQGQRLSTKQFWTVVVLGVVFWFVFVLFMRAASALGLLGGVIGAITFLATIPLSWVTALLVKRMAGLAKGQIFAGLGIATAAAALCDGTAFTYAPWLYASDPAAATLCAAGILWGAGVLLFVSYVMDAQ